jgi:amino acid adenylation domain-containing protein
MNQLPVDRSGGAHLPFAKASLHFDQGLPLSVEEHAAALVVLLYRLTYQSTVTFDVRLPGSSELSHVRLDVIPEARLSELAAQMARILSEPLPLAGKERSNVALAWEGPAPLGYDICIRLGSEGTCDYDAGLFLPATAERFVANLSSIRQQRALFPTVTVADLDFLPPAEVQVLSADGAIELEPLVPFHESFECWARNTPDAPAVAVGQEQLSYGALSRRSNQLAHFLASLGLGEGDAVGVCFGPRVDLLVAILAIFKLGCVYVPLDPTHPLALTRLILSEANPKLLLAESSSLAQSIGDAWKVVEVTTALERASALPATSPNLPVALEARSYTLFTSGTTGKPKGVLATHLNLAHYLRSARNAYGFVPEDRFCSIARYTFSISMFELLAPLTAGASVRLLRRDDVLQPEVFSKILETVSVVHAGPSLLSSLFRQLQASMGRCFPNIRHASSGGDLVSADVMEGMKRAFPNAELFVIYGCTEVSCMGCTYAIHGDAEVTRTYVGQPFPNMKVRVLDSAKKQVPIGAVGEIWFAGLGVVPGYLDRPELDAEKFVLWNDERYYRSGDLGRFAADGQLEILGRSDFQVQVRGMRVELAGLEATVRRLGLAVQCAAVLKRIDAEDARLILFVVAEKANGDGMRKRLAEELPDYMVPQHVVAVEALPLTANGKLDRRALDEVPWQPSAARQDAASAPRNTMEKQAARAFAAALGVEAVGIDDDFFDLGGHSLSAVKVADQLQNLLGMSVSPGALFEAPTVRRLVQHLSQSQTSAHRPILLSHDDGLPKLFLIAGVHIYRELARRLGQNYAVYGVYAGAELTLFDANAKAAPVPDLARRYVEVIRREQAKGPYLLAGLSFGGIVVYEVAQLLRASGESVPFVGLLDAMLPESGAKGLFQKISRFARLPLKRELDLLRGLSKRFRGSGKTPRRAQFAAHGDATFAEMELLREDSYRDSALAYAADVRDFPGPVTLIVAGRRLARAPMSDQNCGWKGKISQLDAHVLDAEHLGLLQEPAVRYVATLFDAACKRP